MHILRFAGDFFTPQVLMDEGLQLKDYYPEIIKRKRNGDTPKEIIKDLPVGKSKGYMELKAVEEFVREFLK